MKIILSIKNAAKPFFWDEKHISWDQTMPLPSANDVIIYDSNSYRVKEICFTPATSTVCIYVDEM